MPLARDPIICRSAFFIVRWHFMDSFSRSHNTAMYSSVSLLSVLCNICLISTARAASERVQRANRFAQIVVAPPHHRRQEEGVAKHTWRTLIEIASQPKQAPRAATGRAGLSRGCHLSWRPTRRSEWPHSVHQLTSQQWSLLTPSRSVFVYLHSPPPEVWCLTFSSRVTSLEARSVLLSCQCLAETGRVSIVSHSCFQSAIT